MEPSVDRRVGSLRVRLEGTDRLPERTSRWVRELFAPVPAPPGPERARLSFRFTTDLPRGDDRYRPHPLGPAADGLWAADHRGRHVLLPLADLERETVRVHPEIDFFFFHEWVYLPLLRARLWAAGACLLRAAGMAIDGRGVALAGASAVGKTLTVLRALAGGAHFLGDDFLCLETTGAASAVTQLVGLRDQARHLVAPRSSAIGSQRARRAAVGASRWLSRVSAPWPQVSIGFARLADAGWRLGLEITGLREVLPAATVGGPVPLELVVLLGPGERAVERSRLGERLAAQARLDVPACGLLEDAFRQAHPGTVAARLFPTAGEEAAFVSSALQRAEVALARDGGAVDEIIAGMVASPGPSGPNGDPARGT